MRHMHIYVHWGTVYTSKDLEPTQMPIDVRLDRENVAHIYHGILCSHKKWWVHVLCRDMDEPGNHYYQQSDTEQKIKHSKFSLIGRCWTMRTHGHREGSITNWGLLGGTSRGMGGLGKLGGIPRGEMPDISDGDGGSKPHCHVCTYAAILHDVLHMYPRT